MYSDTKGISSDNYVVIQGFMCNELNLKGNELLVFALIYGFCQDGKSMFSGGRKYIAETFNISMPTVDKALQGLIDKKLIVKHSSGDFIHTDLYTIGGSKETLLGVVKKLYEGSKETLPNNISNKLNDNDNTNTTNVVLEQPAVTPTTSSVTKTSSSTVRRKLLCPSSDNINTVSKKDNKVTSNKVASNTGYTRDMGVVSPIKKKSLYEKCIDAINEFTDNEEIKNLLVDYLKLRLEMVSYPLYANQWKGCLKHLKELQDSGEDTIAVIKQSIMYSKRGFDPVYKFNNRKKFAEGSRGLKLGMNKNEVITNEAF